MNRDHNFGAFLAAPDSGVAFNSVAGGVNDNAEKAGAIIDRTAHRNPLSMSLLVQFSTALAAAETLGIGYRIEHGNDAALADTADLVKVLPAANIVAVGPAGGGTKTGVVKVDLDLGGAKRFIRVNLTSDLSAANTDTSVMAALVALGAEEVVPTI